MLSSFKRQLTNANHRLSRSLPWSKRNPLVVDESSPLYRFTSGRWVVNEQAQMEARRVIFNVDALQRVATAAVGATAVTSMRKIGESLNRVFVLTFDNGKEAIARLPTPLAGPAHLTTASEVATMDFLRRLGIPVPRVLAWSSRASASDVGAEYIIMEKVEGTTLSEVWDDIDKISFTTALSDILRPLAGLQFKYYGSIYYKTDIPSGITGFPDFLVDSPSGVDVSPFVIGPSADREFWEDSRAVLDIDRGPWSHPSQYLQDVATREQIWMLSSAKPSLFDDPLCVLPCQGKIDDHVELLNLYKSVVLLLTPRLSNIKSGRLWHPDLHRSNIFVINGKHGVDITSLIDWQGAVVNPAYLQLSAPPALDVAATSTSEADPASADTKTEALQTAFETMTFPDMLRLRLRDIRIDLHSMSGCTWRTGLLPMRRSLVKLQDRWNEFAQGVPCPIDFSSEEREAFDNARIRYLHYSFVASELSEKFGLGECGFFSFKDDPIEGEKEFARIQRELEEQHKDFMAQGKPTPEGQLVQSLYWPFRDVLADNPRTHLTV